MLFAIGADDPGRPERAEKGLAGRGGESGIERCRGVSGVPHGLQGIDKSPPTREVECDEFGHRPVA